MEPYKGLRPYEEKDRDNFFGRDEEKRILVDKLLAHKLTLLFAASGVGKSSLLRAAVIPELRTPALENLDVMYCNDWVAEPVATLKQALIDYLRANQLLAADDNTLDAIAGLPELFRNAVLFTSEPLVIILDQFEEFFNYQRYSKTFRPFVEQLAAAVNDRETPTAFVISMREDFALELNAFKPDLPTLLFENFYRLEKLPLERAKTAIAAPVEKLGFCYEDGLLDTLLRDLSQREQVERFGRDVAAAMAAPPVVEPPHLQIVCTQLWDLERANPQRVISRATYDKRGGALGLLGGYFQLQIETLGAAEKKLASAAFNYLVNKHGTKMAYPLPDLAKLLVVEESVLGAVLDKLEHARILRRQLRGSGVDVYPQMDTDEHRYKKSTFLNWLCTKYRRGKQFKGVLNICAHLCPSVDKKIIPAKVPWFELYHDIFSRSIYDWNEAYKAHQRWLRIARIAGVAVLVAAAAFVGTDWWVQRSNFHFRLDSKVGVSDQIELWQGDPSRLPDIFAQRGYLRETAYRYSPKYLQKA